MSGTRTIATLNRLLAIEYRSLPMYLVYGAPWMCDRDQPAWKVLLGITRDQEQICERIAEFILNRRGSPHAGEFPVEYTDLNFLSLEYFLTELLYYQRQDIESIENCVSELAGDAEAQALAQEALGNGRAHLELLEGLVKQPA